MKVTLKPFRYPLPTQKAQIQADIIARIFSRMVILRKFGLHESFLWGHWYPCFELLLTSAPGSKARVCGVLCYLNAMVSSHLPLVPHLVTAWLPSHFDALTFTRIGITPTWKIESNFSQIAEIGNKGNIEITGFTTWKQKIQQQNVTSVSIEPGTLAI